MVIVTEFLRLNGCGAEHLDRLTVFTAQIVEVSDVVVGLRHQQRHLVGGAEPARVLISRERLAELIKTYVADSKIAEDYSQSFGILAALKLTIRALIVLEGVGKSVLTIEDVAYVDIKAGETPSVPLLGENLPGPTRGSKRALVFSQEHQRQQ